MKRRKICIVTGSRAEYGLLYWLMKEIQGDPELQLQVAVTGMHLSPEFGLTYRVIEQDGFTIDAKVEMLLSSDTPVGIAKSMGLGVIGFGEALDRLRPDILVLLGDRYEILAAAQAALVARIPIAHIGGGDTTEGAYDEAIRHSITKMSHLHFVTHEEAARRVRQLGEDSAHIYNFGTPAIDNIRRLTLKTRQELGQLLAFDFKKRNLLVTFHPVTLDNRSSTEQFRELLSALTTLGESVGIIITLPNADNEGRELIQMIENFVSLHPNAKSFPSLGQVNYLSAINHVDAVVGNSSSGLYEVPSFKKSTVNIGDRQKGRLQASSVINCVPEQKAILHAICRALETDCSATLNPYGEGNASKRIAAVLKQLADPQALIRKQFFEIAS